MKYGTLTIGLMVALTLYAGHYVSAEQMHAAGENKTIIMFIPDTDWPPYLIDDPRYPGGGVLLEVFKAIAEPMGYTVETKRLPNKRGWLLLNRGDVHVHAKALEWVEIPENYLWSEPFMQHEGVLLYPADSNLEYTTPEALYGKTLVGIEGFIYPGLEAHFDQGKINRINVTSPFAMLDILKLRRADAAIVNKDETLWLFKNRPELEPERFRLELTPHGKADYRYVFTKDARWIPFIEEFNIRLSEMKSNGELDAILNQYR